MNKIILALLVLGLTACNTTLQVCTDVAQRESILKQLMSGMIRLQILKLEDNKASLFQTTADGSELIWSGTLKQSK